MPEPSVAQAKVELLKALGEVGVTSPVAIRAVSSAVAAYVAAHIRAERSDQRRADIVAYKGGYRDGTLSPSQRAVLFQGRIADLAEFRRSIRRGLDDAEVALGDRLWEQHMEVRNPDIAGSSEEQ